MRKSATQNRNASDTNYSTETAGSGSSLLPAASGGVSNTVLGQEDLLSLGTCPEVSLVKAGQRRNMARATVADGIDSSQVRKAQKVEKEQSQNRSR